MTTPDQKKAADLSEQAIALAEQLGRIAGTIEGTAESWMNQQQLTDQLARVRDSATQMLEGLTRGVTKGLKASKAKGAGQRRPARGRPIRHTRPASGVRSLLPRSAA